MTRPAAVLASALVLTSLPVAADVLLDEVVAVVDARSITRSELEVEAHLHRAFAEGDVSLSRPLDEETLATALDRLVDDLVVYEEAERLQVFRVSEAEVRTATAALELRLGGPAFQRFVAEYEVDDRSLGEIVERQMRVTRYLDGRFRLAARPREAEVRAYFDGHVDEFGGLSFETVADVIRARLQRDRISELSRAFVADVRLRAPVRILKGFRSASDEARRTGSVRASDAGRTSTRRTRAP